MKKRCLILTACMALAGALIAGETLAVRGGSGGRGDGPVIYVTSQDLFYDSIVTADPLPQKGPFQKLDVSGMHPATYFGPGDAGYRGGRWWVDSNGDNVMDGGDHYFSCPLLGPGREVP